jgi:hypothetical protein
MILINTPISKLCFDICQPFCESSSMPSEFQPQTYADTKDKDGFAEPVTPSDTMRLLTAYMRTNILSLVQFAVRELYDTIDQSPIYSVAMALDEVLKVTVEKTPDNTLTQNPYHVVEGHRFDFTVDYDHDLRLLAHHVQRIKVIIADIEDTSGLAGS